MKTKFRVELTKFGTHTDAMVKMICNHNSGDARIDLSVLEGYIKARAAQYPTLFDGKNTTKVTDNNALHISENDVCYMSIYEIEVHELEVPNEEVNEDEMSLTQ